MADFIITQKLVSGRGKDSQGNRKGITTTDQIDDETLEKKQSYLNSLFNQGKGWDKTNQQEVQLGKTYTAGTGLTLTPGAAGGEFSLKAADTNGIGGIQLSSAPESYAEENTSFPVVGVNNASTAKVEVPMANTNHSGLMSKALFDKLSALPTRAGLTTELGNKANKSLITSSSEAANAEFATTAHAKGSYFFIGDVLYRALDAINENDAIVTDSTMSGYNAAAVTIEGEMGRCINGMQSSTKTPFSSLSALTAFISTNTIVLHNNDYAFIIEASSVSDTRKALKLYRYSGIQWEQDCEMLKAGDGLDWLNNTLYLHYTTTDEFVTIHLTAPSGYSLSGTSISYYLNGSSTAETPVPVETDSNGTTGVAVIHVAHGDSYKIDAPVISGLQTLLPFYATATYAARDVNFVYPGASAVSTVESVHVYVGIQNGAGLDSYAGVNVTVINTTTNTTIFTGNTNASGRVDFTIPDGVTYEVTVPNTQQINNSGHELYLASTNPVTYTAQHGNVQSIVFEYRDNNTGVFAIYYNENNTSDPNNYDGNPYNGTNNGVFTYLDLKTKTSPTLESNGVVVQNPNYDQDFDVNNINYLLIATAPLMNAEETSGVHAKFLIKVDDIRTRNFVTTIWGSGFIPNLEGINSYDGYSTSKSIYEYVSDPIRTGVTSPAVTTAYQTQVNATIAGNSYQSFLGTRNQWYQLGINRYVIDNILDIVRPMSDGTSYYKFSNFSAMKWTSTQIDTTKVVVWNILEASNLTGKNNLNILLVPFYDF